MSQGHKDSSEMLCLVVFPHHHLNSCGRHSQLGMKEQEDHRVCYKDQLSPPGVRSFFNFLCSGFRSILVLWRYQESPKVEICGD